MVVSSLTVDAQCNRRIIAHRDIYFVNIETFLWNNRIMISGHAQDWFCAWGEIVWELMGSVTIS